jgi:hypothetical protein
MTTKIGIDFLTAEVANTITAAASAFDTIGANNQVLTSNGSALVWADPSGGGGMTIYDDEGDLPSTGVGNGSFAYVRSDSSLYAYIDGQWVATNSRNANIFYILQTDSFSAPITGNNAFIPTRNITLTSIDLTVSSNVATNLVVRVRQNSTELQQFTILAGNGSSSGDFSNNTVLSTDSIFLDIVSGSGTDLVAKFIYK